MSKTPAAVIQDERTDEQKKLFKNKTNYFESLMNFSKNFMGAGIFSIGVGFKHAGMIPAVIIATLQSLMITQGVRCLADALEFAVAINNKEIDEGEPIEDKEVEKQARLVGWSQMTYIVLKTAPWSFRDKLATIVSGMCLVLIFIQYTGNCSLYLVFVGTTVKQFIDSFGYNVNKRLMIVCAAVPMGALALVPNMKKIALVSALGNVMFVCTYLVINYYLISKLITVEVFDIVMVGKPMRIPILFGMVLFTLETVAVIFPMRNEMQKPSHLLMTPFGIINLGFLFGYILMVTMGIMSYLAYGSTLQSAILEDLPKEEIIARIGLITVTLQIATTYPLNLYVPYSILFKILMRRHGPFTHNRCWDLLSRLIIIAISLIMAIAIPYIDLMLGLIGCVCATWLTLFLGPLLNIIIYSPILSQRKKAWLLTKDIVIMICAMIFFVFGFTFTIMDLVNAVRRDLGHNVDE